MRDELKGKIKSAMDQVSSNVNYGAIGGGSVGMVSSVDIDNIIST